MAHTFFLVRLFCLACCLAKVPVLKDSRKLIIGHFGSSGTRPYFACAVSGCVFLAPGGLEIIFFEKEKLQIFRDCLVSSFLIIIG